MKVLRPVREGEPVGTRVRHRQRGWTGTVTCWYQHLSSKIMVLPDRPAEVRAYARLFRGQYMTRHHLAFDVIEEAEAMPLDKGEKAQMEEDKILNAYTGIIWKLDADGKRESIAAALMTPKAHKDEERAKLAAWVSYAKDNPDADPNDYEIVVSLFA